MGSSLEQLLQPREAKRQQAKASILIEALSPIPAIEENGSLILPFSGKNFDESDFKKLTGKNSIPLARHSYAI